MRRMTMLQRVDEFRDERKWSKPEYDVLLAGAREQWKRHHLRRWEQHGVLEFHDAERRFLYVVDCWRWHWPRHGDW
jgi:hypothetical protein